MTRSFGSFPAGLLVVLGLPFAVHAQAAGSGNDAHLLSGVSAAALGLPSGVSIGLANPSVSYGGALVVGDIAFGPGALRLVAAHPANFESYGIGYAGLLARRTVAPLVRTTLGADLSLGYVGLRLRRSVYTGNATSMDARLALPVGVQVGAPDRVSITPYLAPYAEVGAAPTGYWTVPGSGNWGPGICTDASRCTYFYSGHHRTAAIGASVGVHVAVWRLGLDGAYGAAPGSRRALAMNPVTVGFSIRF